ncbi:MAG TPA: cytochrome c-type biogenesis protein [Gaiellaceae bacterium]|nr:cytochrome c-type biogenesis protein [Gaiellaceae bacterium]
MTISGRCSRGIVASGVFVMLFLVFAAVLVLDVSSAVASERRPTLAELEREVMCPTCQTPLELSDAPIAERMRVFIRARIAAGDTKSEIKAKLVADFGEGVLTAPPTHGFGLLAWVLPFAGLLGFGAAIGVVAWRWTRVDGLGPERAGQNDDGRFDLDPAVERRLDEELARFDV